MALGDTPKSSSHLFELSDKNEYPSVHNVSSDSDESYPLTPARRHQLDAVIQLFPNYEKQGLAQKSLIKHSIDMGNF